FHSSCHHPHLHSFPTRRSSDLTGGNIFQGAMTLNQLFFLRPAAGYANYRTPIRGLYLCGAATHPGGGVMGACGLNAAREILRDRSEEHTSELQSQSNLVCRLLL